MKNIYIIILQHLTRLDGATLKRDSKIKKYIIRKIKKPIGFYFRKKLYEIKYK